MDGCNVRGYDSRHGSPGLFLGFVDIAVGASTDDDSAFIGGFHNQFKWPRIPSCP